MSDSESSSDDRELEGVPRGCLPVAELPADFEGEAQDGATYLALAR